MMNEVFLSLQKLVKCDNKQKSRCKRQINELGLRHLRCTDLGKSI